MMRSLAATLALLLALAGIPLRAESVAQIDAASLEALARLEQLVPGVKQVQGAAAGVLVFPEVVKMGFGVGGQYGEGVLLVAGEPAAYYALAGGAYGLPLGAGTKSAVVLFRTAAALANFSDSRSWAVGEDGDIALPASDANHAKAPVAGYLFTSQGLLDRATFEGAKISRIAR